MAIEEKRGCGYRKVGGLYLVGGYVNTPCDRLPLPISTCPVCGQGIKVSRGFTEINPLRLFGPHYECKDRIRPCFLCDPADEPAYIMGVGERYYTPESFLQEAHHLGICKRIPFIPKDLVLGKTVVYLAHPKAVEVKQPAALQEALSIIQGSETEQPRLLETETVERGLGIFCAFIPRAVEKLIWETEATPQELEKLEKRGIKPIIVPPGDKDHA